MLLVGDVGGTKTVLAIYSPKGELRKPLIEETFPSDGYPNLEAIIHEFLGRAGVFVERASLGVAGPVVDGRAKITNLPWELDETQLYDHFNWSSVRLINDLTAIALAVPHLQPADLFTINPGRPVLRGAKAVVAPGTGLGEAFLTWNGERYQAHPSEGGHADMAPTNELQLGLVSYLLERFERVSYERVCSGMGLPQSS